MGLTIVVRLLKKIVIVKRRSLYFTKAKLDRSTKMTISGKYPINVDVNIKRNAMEALVFRGKYFGWETSRTASFALTKIGTLRRKLRINNKFRNA